MYFSSMINVVILGAGNVAKHIFTAFSAVESIELVQLYNRNPKALHYAKGSVPVVSDLHELAEADMYIIAVSDDAIASLSGKLPFRDRLVVHTSGSVSLHDLNKKNRRGVFYPLQTFSKDIPIDFSTVPLCLEAEEKNDYNLLKNLGESLGCITYKIFSDQRRSLHMAAVFANNFSNHLYRIAHEICDSKNMSFDILKPLIQQTAKKIMETTPYQAQTGPAKRGDKKVVKKHLKLLEKDIHKDVYSLLTQSIEKTYGR